MSVRIRKGWIRHLAIILSLSAFSIMPSQADQGGGKGGGGGGKGGGGKAAPQASAGRAQHAAPKAPAANRTPAAVNHAPPAANRAPAAANRAPAAANRSPAAANPGRANSASQARPQLGTGNPVGTGNPGSRANENAAMRDRSGLPDSRAQRPDLPRNNTPNDAIQRSQRPALPPNAGSEATKTSRELGNRDAQNRINGANTRDNRGDRGQGNRAGADRVGDFLDLQRPLQPGDRDGRDPSMRNRVEDRDRANGVRPDNTANENRSDAADKGLRDARMIDREGGLDNRDLHNRGDRNERDVNDRGEDGRNRDPDMRNDRADQRDRNDRGDRDGDQVGRADRDGRDWWNDRRHDNQPRIDENRFNRGQSAFNHRPKWANNNRQYLTNVNRILLNQSNQLNAYGYNNNRINYWNNWANPVRGFWLNNLLGVNYFTPTWFNNHSYNWGAYSYGYAYNSRPWYYWWNAPRYNQFSNWFSWGPSVTWTQPIYYDYGPGGNVYYQDNMVYVNSQPLVSADEYAQSAALLATVEPPADPNAVKNEDWLPLGTFALVADRDQVEPQQFVQLAVNRDGVVSGTLFNEGNDQAAAIQGQVDKETQRVAFRVDNNEDVVYEAGLYNLTQPEAPVLVHYGTDRSEQQVLVRLEAPDNTENAQTDSLPSPAVEP